MKNLLLAGMAAVVALSAPSVASATENFGGSIPWSISGPVNYTGFFGTSHTTDFVDTWTFTTPALGTADVVVSSIGINAANIDFTGATLNGTALTITNGVLDIAQIVGWTVPFGTNTLILTGTSGSDASYSGTVNYSVSAVPEPATWAMMIGGFGIAGVAMRRRARRVAVSFS